MAWRAHAQNTQKASGGLFCGRRIANLSERARSILPSEIATKSNFNPSTKPKSKHLKNTCFGIFQVCQSFWRPILGQSCGPYFDSNLVPQNGPLVGPVYLPSASRPHFGGCNFGIPSGRLSGNSGGCFR